MCMGLSKYIFIIDSQFFNILWGPVIHAWSIFVITTTLLEEGLISVLGVLQYLPNNLLD